MSVKIVKPESHEEWLKMRANFIGSSEVSTVLGMNPYTSKYAYWCKKQDAIAGKITEAKSEVMLLGHLFEDAVAQRLKIATGISVIESSNGDWFYVNDRYEWMGASPDRTYFISGMPRNNKNKGIIECKTTNLDLSETDERYITMDGYQMDDAAEGGKIPTEVNIPISWYCQLQYLMACGEREEGYLAWIHLMKRQSYYVKMTIDNQFVDQMLKELNEFYYKYIVGLHIPDMTASDVKSVYPSSEEKSKEVNVDTYNTYLEYIDADRRAKLAKREADALRDELIAKCDESDTYTYGGQKIYTFRKSKCSAKLNAVRLQMEQPEIYEQYLEEVEGSRRFVLTKTK